MSNTERTFIMVKPDGVQRGLVGEIVRRFEQRGYHLAALKLVQVCFLIYLEVFNYSRLNTYFGV